MNEGLEIVYESSYKKLQSQLERSSAIDTKTSIVLAVYGFIIGALCSNIPDKFECDIILVLFFISFSSLVIGLYQAILSLTTKSFKVPPNVRVLKNKYLNEERGKVIRVLTASYINAYEYNDDLLDQKIKMVDYSLKYSLPFSVIFSVLTLLSASFGG
jgi:hypothetical protein